MLVRFGGHLSALSEGQRGLSMVEFLSTLTNAVVTLFHLLINMVSGLVQFFLMVPQFLTYMNVVFAYVPAPLVVFLSLGVSISVLLLIIGRN